MKSSLEEISEDLTRRKSLFDFLDELIFGSVQKSGGLRLEVRSPGSCHELEEEVFIVDKSICVAFDNLGEVVRSLQFSRTHDMPSMVDDTFQMVLHGRGE